MSINRKSVFKIAERETPSVDVVGKNGWLRHNVIDILDGDKNVGIELGVAGGIFAKRMVDSNKFSRFYGVDIYGDAHDTEEYCQALKYIGFTNPIYCLLRMDFDSAINLFEDESVDFVYIDGYAHTGEEGGKTLIDWLKKVKTGGVLAGDDYHKEWPFVVWAVNDLAKQLGVTVNVTLGTENAPYSSYPTWFIRKPKAVGEPEINPMLFDLAMEEKDRVHRLRTGKRQVIRSFIGRILDKLGIKEIVLKILKLLH